MSDRGGGDAGDKSVPALLGELGGQLSALVGQGDGPRARRAAGGAVEGVKAAASLSGAALAALFGSLFVSSAAAWGLSEVMAPGFAFLVAGGAYLVVAAVLAVIATHRKPRGRIRPVVDVLVERKVVALASLAASDEADRVNLDQQRSGAALVARP